MLRASDVLRTGSLALLCACTAEGPASSHSGGLTATAERTPAQQTRVVTGQFVDAGATPPAAAQPQPAMDAAASSAQPPIAGSEAPSPSMTASGSPAVSPRALLDTQPGESPLLDPDQIYAVGDSSEALGAGLDRPDAIAALSATDQAILGIPLFSSVYLRRTDGHVLYSYLGSAPDGLGITSGLFEFRRDAAPFGDGNDVLLTTGESVVEDAQKPCGPTPSGDTLRYRVALDGSVYHTCGGTYELAHRSTNENDYEAWYDASGKRVYFGLLGLETIGAEGRALAFANDGAWAVIDLADGSTVATAMPMKPRVTGSGFNGGAFRARADGFWLAFTAVDSMSPEALWTSLDLAGNVVGEGSYVPLPSGVAIPTNNWGELWPALDAQGALYQFAAQGDELLIVKRPMQEGTSEIVYRQSSWDGTHPHDVLPRLLLTGI
jgi:hypothetical protein